MLLLSHSVCVQVLQAEGDDCGPHSVFSFSSKEKGFSINLQEMKCLVPYINDSVLGLAPQLRMLHAESVFIEGSTFNKT